MNLIDFRFGRELRTVVDEIAADTSIRAVVFRSAIPGVFIPGIDLRVLADLDAGQLDEFGQLGDMFDRVAALPQPTVCAMAGSAIGAGFEFALACDFRFLASGNNEIGLPEVRLGLLPGGGGTQRLPRIVGAARAIEMLVKGMRYDPAAALSFGLVHRVVEPEALREEAHRFARGLARQAPLAVQRIKRLVRASFESSGPEGMALERRLFFELLCTEDAREGLRAFLEGRAPRFTGR
jgi:enoyl-CoA hydratase/carnithine racemase